MPRPFTLPQLLENRAFLAALARTGNVRAAAREVGAHRAKFTRRRARDAGFAQEWAAALTLAQANLAAPAPVDRPAAETVRRRDGTLQLRARRPERLTPRARQAFLVALSATANVRLSAKAAGFTHSAFYQAKARDPAFSREWRLALEQGYKALEAALQEAADPASHRDDAWRRRPPRPAVPPLTADQALQLLRLHQKEVKFRLDPPHLKQRRGEHPEAWSFRLRVMWEEDRERQRAAFRVAEAERRAAGEAPWPETALREGEIAPLPDLEALAGWTGEEVVVAPVRAAVGTEPTGEPEPEAEQDWENAFAADFDWESFNSGEI